MWVRGHKGCNKAWWIVLKGGSGEALYWVEWTQYAVDDDVYDGDDDDDDYDDYDDDDDDDYGNNDDGGGGDDKVSYYS